MKPAPKGPSRFGHETTIEDIEARIEWETWAESVQREEGCNALADAHALTRAAYQDLIAKVTS